MVLLGDSYVDYGSHTLPADLAAESGQQWRIYALLGASMASGGISFIPPQFDQALAADPDICVVVMDGGGNDILVPNAFMLGSGDCKQTCRRRAASRHGQPPRRTPRQTQR